MKRLLFLLIPALAALALQAQDNAQKSDLYEIVSHSMGEFQFQTENFMRQHDGDFLFCTFVTIEGPTQFSYIDIGNIFYKVSPTTLTVTDSLFVEDPNAPFYLFAPNPIGEGNIRANFEYVEECDSTFLRICHFPDNNLTINHDDDIVVPVCAGFAGGNFDSHTMDSRGDLIMKYSKLRPDGGCDEHIARFGHDGTLKHQALLFENQNIVIPKLRVFKESPLQYYQWRSNAAQNLSLIVIDSLFHKNTIVLSKMLRETVIDTLNNKEHEYLAFNFDTEVIPIGGDDVLVAAQYKCDTNFDPIAAENGVAVAKYDIRTMRLKDYIVFNDYTGWDNGARCKGLKQMSDGTVYFIYKETGYPEESFVAVKMDTDLNVIWKRFCKSGNIIFHGMVPFQFPILYEDEQGEEQGVSWAGGGTDANNATYLIYFFLNHDGTVSINESGIEVRPYAFYPNPTREQLYMHFSPDVQPKQIELYDLQGRLVRTQSKAFESIDMSQLPAGTYTLRVTLEDGKTYSDKVVKE